MATARLRNKLSVGCRSFQYQFIRKSYITGKDELSELTNCAKNSVKFPITSFAFRAGDMRSDDAKEFLTVMGSSIKKLTLSAVGNATLCGEMNLCFILSHTPNLQTLIFEGGSNYVSIAPKQLFLPSLKTIEIACQLYVDTIADFELILNGAPNLENIVAVWRLDDLKPIFNTNKVHTIKSWCPSKFPWSSGLVHLVTASKDALRLNELVITIADIHHTLDRVDAKQLWKCLFEVLDKNTIQKLILNFSKYPANVSFPLNMDNVKELVLMPHSKSEVLRYFPVDTKMNSTFPRLHTLSFYDPLYHVCCANPGWEDYVPLSDEILPTVTTLNLRGESTSIRMLRKLKKMCPNVRNLEIHLKEKSDKEFIIKELCGEWRNLKKLSIDLQTENLASLDSVFTGLSPECIQSLNDDRSLTEQEKLEKAENTRYVLWIGNISGKNIGQCVLMIFLS